MLRVEIDRSLCSGFGSCAELAPDDFVLADDGRAEVLHGATEAEAVIDAAESCPMGAIAVYDAETGRQLV